MGIADRQIDTMGPEGRQDMVLAEVLWEVPFCVRLPIEILNVEQAFPLLDSTLEDLGIARSAVEEKVVWVDSKRTRVKNKLGKLKEKEVVVLEVRVKAKRPGDPKTQEVTYRSETHSDRPYCHSSVDIRPWKHHWPENHLKPVEMTLTCPQGKPTQMAEG
ncbi:uncharacterized protein [Paramormyrops kingsleyae]|uniref:uncharacterized protein n=1 Tax=Paramormyrops kingsleyae TaxID=1676925 RepID=UPI003B978C35